jgi:catechol 2,3-dioxygenase-like lactoylglutathione lyase family enzyme
MRAGEYDVGGVVLPRPFKIRRFGHFGFNCTRMDAMVDFYTRDLGLKVSDRSDRLAMRQPPEVQASLDGSERSLHFMRYGTEHHQLVLISAKLWSAVDPEASDRSINQVTWQVGSLQEVVDAATWIGRQGGRVLRAGRDMPGSNWHGYIADPDGHVHELYYGMEQVGWDGLSKPRQMWERDGAMAAPDLPRPPESAEVDAAVDADVDLSAGHRGRDDLEAAYAVDGVMLARPFKVVGLGPVSLYVDDVDRSVEFHTHILGFNERRRVAHAGHTGAMLTHGANHHDLVVYDRSVREVVGHAADRSAMALGVRVANYRQLCAAVDHLVGRGAEPVAVPAELVPGFDYVQHLRDPDGNLIQLYYYLAQAHAPGGPPPTTSGDRTNWPDRVIAPPDVFGGEVFIGPWD